MGPVLTHRAGGDDKAGNAYYVGSVLGLPNATEQDYPQVWAYAEMRRSARVASVRYLPIVWKSRLGRQPLSTMGQRSTGFWLPAKIGKRSSESGAERVYHHPRKGLGLPACRNQKTNGPRKIHRRGNQILFRLGCSYRVDAAIANAFQLLEFTKATQDTSRTL